MANLSNIITPTNVLTDSNTATLTNKTWNSNAIGAAYGGTGTTSLTANNVILGNGTSAVQFVAPGTNGNVLTSNGTTWVSQAAGASLTGITQSVSPFETSLGADAGLNTTGVNSTFIGYYAGRANTTGTNNTAMGYLALSASTTGGFNVAVGASALEAFNANTTTGTANVAVGGQAMQAATTATGCTAVGVRALWFLTTGTNNTAVGTAAGYSISTGTNNTCIGNFAGSSITTGTNNTVIGSSASSSSATVSNEITLGNSSISVLRCQVTTITSLSDARDKTNISDLPAGLTFVKALRPVEFDWNMRDGGKVGEHDTGFIAQDLKAAQESAGVRIPGLVYESNPDRLEAGYGKLIPVLVKAIQELSAEVENLKSQMKGN